MNIIGYLSNGVSQLSQAFNVGYEPAESLVENNLNAFYMTDQSYGGYLFGLIDKVKIFTPYGFALQGCNDFYRAYEILSASHEEGVAITCTQKIQIIALLVLGIVGLSYCYFYPTVHEKKDEESLMKDLVWVQAFARMTLLNMLATTPGRIDFNRNASRTENYVRTALNSVALSTSPSYRKLTAEVFIVRTSLRGAELMVLEFPKIIMNIFINRMNKAQSL